MNNFTSSLSDRDPANFLHIAGQGTAVSTHAQLWQWLQGDVQHWLRHDALVVGWGDFRTGELQYDIVSSVPGLRSQHFTRASIAPLISYLRDCWVAAQQSPCEVDITGCQQLLGHCNWQSTQAIGSMRTALVHGTTDGPNGNERIYAALSTLTSVPTGGGAALKLLMPFIAIAPVCTPPPRRRSASASARSWTGSPSARPIPRSAASCASANSR
jgi:hypothetical protein